MFIKKFSRNTPENPFLFYLKILCVLCVLCGYLTAQRLPLAPPQTAGMSAEKLNLIDALVEKDIADKKLPGAVIIVGHKDKIVFRKAYGSRALVPAVEKMTVDTIFDIASLTKVVATTTSIMILVERGQLRLNDTIGKYIPEIEDKDAKSVTIQQLLTHTSGYAPDFDLREKWTGREGMLQALYKEKLRSAPGTKFVYSDIGFIVLGEIIHRHFMPLAGNHFRTFFDGFVRENVFDKLRMNDTYYFDDTRQKERVEAMLRRDSLLPRIAPTENIKGQQSYLGGQFFGQDGEKILRGVVHDPTAYRMGGVAGHAGLFSTADDLARFCQMLLNGGILEGKRILSANTVARMTAPIVVSEDGATRGLGWDINTGFSSNRGELFPLGSFGHTGFTGTSIWIDRVSQTFVVFLSNRVHPDGKGDVTPLRAKVATVAASAVEDTPIEAFRLAEDIYWSQVGPQIEKFKVGSKPSAVSSQSASESFTVLNGVDVIERDKFKQLDGLRVGLVTNHTGRNRAGIQTIDVLKAAPNVKLTALFAPEHGIRGQADESVGDSTDEKTGLPVYSLYGETRRPKPEQLKDLDAIVFDVQDVGERFYTYMATLKNVMEEAAKAKLKVFVLDRPNPLGGVEVEGPVADGDKLSFVVTHTTAVRHGMTAGEWALMVNSENKINCDLTVIKMENWRRGLWFDQTDQAWINPSPNMRSLAEATLYPGVGLLETTNVSVGRGTDTPFEVMGAPWLDGQKLASYLNGRNIPGVRFIPVRFKPNASVFKDQECGGINILVIDRARFKPVRMGIEIAAALRKLYPDDWKTDNYNRLLANQETFDRIKRGDAPEDIEKGWQPVLNEFLKRRAQFLLY
jgi:uncharacterized protein YbbC (DUF1343 family)/CubicO group peptidase (beta-lactamase class C family)